eukprot:311334-Rhodomonas_salina.1
MCDTGAAYSGYAACIAYPSGGCAKPGTNMAYYCDPEIQPVQETEMSVKFVPVLRFLAFEFGGCGATAGKDGPEAF